jgi:hypothetical protein
MYPAAASAPGISPPHGVAQVRRRLWVILLGVPAFLAAADAVYWHLSVQRLQAGYADWVADRRAHGWSIEAGQAQTGGWPAAANLSIPHFTIHGAEADIPGGVSWSAATLQLRLPLFHPGNLEIIPQGEQQMRLGVAAEIPYTAEHLTGMLTLRRAGEPLLVGIEASNFRIQGSGRSRGISVAGVRLHGSFDPGAAKGEPAASVQLAATQIGLPPGFHSPLGDAIASTEADLSISGPVPPVAGITRRARKWRDEGGSLEVSRFGLVWGPLNVSGTATLALDDQLQPMGGGTARIAGYRETLDTLADHGAISRSAATAANALLSLIAHTADDGAEEVEVPLTLQYRTLLMRQVPLLRFPELDWPEPRE